MYNRTIIGKQFSISCLYDWDVDWTLPVYKPSIAALDLHPDQCKICQSWSRFKHMTTGPPGNCARYCTTIALRKCSSWYFESCLVLSMGSTFVNMSYTHLFSPFILSKHQLMVCSLWVIVSVNIFIYLLLHRLFVEMKLLFILLKAMHSV